MSGARAIMEGWPCFRPVADFGLLVEFGDAISPQAHEAVLNLDARLGRRSFPGFVEAVPANVNLLVAFDPGVTDHARVENAVLGLLADPVAPRGPATIREVLVCYDGEFGRDLEAVAERTGLSPDQVIDLHLSGEYEVYMYGFAPGYAYLGGLPDALTLPRKPAALRSIEAGSVVIAGRQCLVTTLAMPNGWWILGRSPTRILTGDERRPFLFDVADRVVFRRISRAAFDAASAGA